MLRLSPFVYLGSLFCGEVRDQEEGDRAWSTIRSTRDDCIHATKYSHTGITSAPCCLYWHCLRVLRVLRSYKWFKVAYEDFVHCTYNLYVLLKKTAEQSWSRAIIVVRGLRTRLANGQFWLMTLDSHTLPISSSSQVGLTVIRERYTRPYTLFIISLRTLLGGFTVDVSLQKWGL